MSDLWQPIDHRPPLPRIETSPSYTPAPQLLPEHIEQQFKIAEDIRRKREGDRLWGHIVDVVKGT
ncbi:MAG: hypothetical protein EPN91_05530 [Salinibacterium sp.]|nr:MAG: hypothetical protein EPN91_05530 [Salinibacterium sp.]